MDAKIVKRPGSYVLGIGARINPMEAEYGELWEKQFTPRHDEIKALATEDDYFGAYYGTEEEGMADFIAGMAVGELDQVPEGLVHREIPAGEYAAFECTMATIGPTWGAIYEQWLPESGYVEDETRPSLEQYPPDMGEGPDAPVTILVPIKAS